MLLIVNLWTLLGAELIELYFITSNNWNYSIIGVHSADSCDSANPTALCDCEDVASNLHGTLHSEFVERKTDLFQKSHMRDTCRGSFKM